jgi:hypothetical protein
MSQASRLAEEFESSVFTTRCHRTVESKGNYMGRGILLWMLGVPIPIILLLAMCSH